MTSSAGLLPPNLVDAVRSGNCVAFVGAGFSAAAGLPTWHRLLDELAQDAEPTLRAHVQSLLALRSAHALDEAAQALEDALTRGRFEEELEKRFGNPRTPERMRDRLRWLLGIPFRAILTTNFDGLLDGVPRGPDAYRSVLRPPSRPWWHRVGPEGDSIRTTIVKLHGDVRERKSVVFVRQDYRKLLYGDPGYREFMRVVLANHPVLYLGFSFTDAYLNELRSETLAMLGHTGEHAPVAYALVNDAPELTRRHFKKHEGVHVLSFSTDGGRDFSGFDKTLGALFEATNPLFQLGRLLAGKRILWLDPHPDNNLEVRHFFSVAEAAARVGPKASDIRVADDAPQALEALRQAQERAAPFELLITHWGEGLGDNGQRLSTAEALLDGMRREDFRVPVIIFSRAWDVEIRKRRALSLGAQGYCFTYEGLLRTIERVLDPAMETN